MEAKKGGKKRKVKTLPKFKANSMKNYRFSSNTGIYLLYFTIVFITKLTIKNTIKSITIENGKPSDKPRDLKVIQYPI